MQPDATLLDDYVRNRSEAAFSELVRRHVNFVYAAALRQVNGDAHLAQDVAQTVFTDLARKAPALARHPELIGWLFTSTRFAAAKQIRGEQRRRVREQEAQLMLNDPAPMPGETLDWDRVRPVLDEALAELNDRDRRAILLRCLQDLDFASVGRQLALSDNAARMCVDRALDKLRGALDKRGIRSTTAALTVALAHQAAVAAPAGLANAITGTALAGATAGGGLLTFMSLTKLQWSVASAAVLAGAGVALVQDRERQNLQRELAAAPVVAVADQTHLQQSNQALAAAARSAEALKVDDAQWTRLRDDAVALRTQLEDQARAARRAEAEARLRASREAYSLQQLDHRPKAMIRVAPTYPYALREAKIAGSVVVEMVIDHRGQVIESKVLESTAKEFESPTLLAVNRWRFSPGLKDGRQVNTRVTQKLEFDPSTTAASAPERPTWF